MCRTLMSSVKKKIMFLTRSDAPRSHCEKEAVVCGCGVWVVVGGRGGTGRWRMGGLGGEEGGEMWRRWCGRKGGSRSRIRTLCQTLFAHISDAYLENDRCCFEPTRDSKNQQGARAAPVK